MGLLRKDTDIMESIAIVTEKRKRSFTPEQKASRAAAQRRWRERNLEKSRERVRIAVNEKYAHDEVYREDKKLMNRLRYYEKQGLVVV